MKRSEVRQAQNSYHARYRYVSLGRDEGLGSSPRLIISGVFYRNILRFLCYSLAYSPALYIGTHYNIVGMVECEGRKPGVWVRCIIIYRGNPIARRPPNTDYDIYYNIVLFACIRIASSAENAYNIIFLWLLALSCTYVYAARGI